MKISTKNGDKGMTSLYSGKRVLKNSPVIEALGALDELQSFIGFCRFVIGFKDGKAVCGILDKIQDDIYKIMAIVGGEEKEKNSPLVVTNYREKFTLKSELRNNNQISQPPDVEFLEKEIEKYERRFGNIRKFVKPGMNEAGARFHIARTVCRRAERRVVAYFAEKEMEKKGGEEYILKYLNRLSDLLFLMACKFEATK